MNLSRKSDISSSRLTYMSPKKCLRKLRSIYKGGDLAWNKHREERVREMKEREKELIRAQNGYTSRRNPQQ